MASMADLHNDEAERSILGAVLCKPDIIYDIQGFLADEDFFHASNRLVYKSMREMAADREAIEITSLVERLRKDGNLDRAGGILTVAEINNTISTAAYVQQHIGIVKTMSQRRRLLMLSQEMEQLAQDLTEDLDFPAMQSKLAGISMQKSVDLRDMKTRMVDFCGWMDERTKSGNQGVMTGLQQLDLLTHGWQPTDLIILAARPSMGKSALALKFALSAALKSKKKIAYFSLEMSENQLLARAVANITGIDSIRISNPDMLNNDEWGKIMPATDILSKCGLYIETKDVSTPSEICSRMRQIQAKFGLDLVVIDHIQLMAGGKKNNDGNRTQEMSGITRDLKLMAGDFEVPIIALSQLNRGLESRMDKHPLLSDLRESGSIEQDANVVISIYRDKYYTKDESQQDIVDVTVLKNRDGATGKIELEFIPKISQFITHLPIGQIVRDGSIPV